MCDGNQHNVHQSDATDSQREQSDKAEQNLDAGRNYLRIKKVGEYVKNENGSLIFAIDTVMETPSTRPRLLRSLRGPMHTP
jgi:hypothetical protein